jgi:hypothetical protein
VSTKDEDGADPNQDKRIRIDVQGSSDAAPKKCGPMAGTKQNRTALASVASIINGVGALDALPMFRLLNDSAAKPDLSKGIRVDAHGRIDAPPKERGTVTGS